MASMLKYRVYILPKGKLIIKLTNMKTNLKKASLLLTGVLVGSKLFAQTPDTSAAAKDYVKPFSGGGELRTWSVGVHGGLLTPFTIFGRNNHQDFTNPTEQFGYG